MDADLQAALAEIAERWAHGHDELTDGCSLCIAEYDEVFSLIHQRRPGPARTKVVWSAPWPRELAIAWGIVPADELSRPTPMQRAIDILAPHLAWDHRYRP